MEGWIPGSASLGQSSGWERDQEGPVAGSECLCVSLHTHRSSEQEGRGPQVPRAECLLGLQLGEPQRCLE